MTLGRRRDSIRRRLRFITLATWALLLSAVAVMWALHRSRPRTWWRVGESRRSVVVAESYGGQLLFLYVRLGDGTVQDRDTAVRPFAYGDILRLHWTVPGDDFNRHMRAQLIERTPDYWHLSPRPGDGPFLSWPFGIGCVHVVGGRIPVDEDRASAPDRLTWVQVILPSWLILLAFGFIPAVFMFRPALRRIARWRRPAGTCSACGYDLRASPDRCPECGTAVAGNRTGGRI